MPEQTKTAAHHVTAITTAAAEAAANSSTAAESSSRSSGWPLPHPHHTHQLQQSLGSMML
jgi:hypothetical protein